MFGPLSSLGANLLGQETSLLGQETSLLGQETVFLGDDLLPWLTLAIGGALFAGTATALIRPRTDVAEGELATPPLIRSLIQMLIGLVASVWAIASLLGGPT